MPPSAYKKWTINGTGAVASQEVTLPLLTPGNVAIQVHAVCLLPLDCAKSGYSFSGTVISSFTNSQYPIGAKVFGFFATSTQKEYHAQIITPEWSIHKMKTNLSFLESSTLAGPGLLACHALQVAQLPGSGRPRVLIHGGQTGLSTFLIQAARVMKCEVECTAPVEFRDSCKNLGCGDFVDLIEGTPAGLTLSSFRGRWERNFHAVFDCLGDDITLYDYIEKYTHEGSKYITVKERSVSWAGFFKRLTTSVPHDYIYLSSPLTAENAKQKLDVVYNLLGHQDFVGIEIQDEYSIEDLGAALRAVRENTGFGCTVVEVTSPDTEEFEDLLDEAKQTGQLSVEAYEAENSRGGKKGNGGVRSRRGSLVPKKDVFSLE
ncbi:Predicted protein [Taphrina deformans PYCC 5710]|uniref:Enoyl reductase (ER) domain-containing protein n=1 Tax=Taphrina deformans (strain PYCC 5710 / ATCC 11124 / CBS 356.35 / IMI 108563 / JCM 9778 / NBRC 8474) TaxID=1097556 RepID=R4ZYP1_TAPDE|nr:Predicted protein [Taphrina deformans PYCC 5710]|eukprot:CCX35441.1 Predicted protein [Taphrina deformans PYCC 5710]